MNSDPDPQGVPDLPLISRCRAAGRSPQVRRRPAGSYSPCVRLAWLLAHRGQANCTHR